MPAFDTSLFAADLGPITADVQAKAERARIAGLNTARWVLDHADGAPAVLAELLDALGLRGQPQPIRPHRGAEAMSLTHQAELAAKREAESPRKHRNQWDTHTPAPCGTYQAYRRHLSNGSTVCEPCREAGRQQSVNRRKREKDTR